MSSASKTFDGLADNLIRKIISDLKLTVLNNNNSHRNSQEQETQEEDMRQLRNILACFASSRPQRERLVARLALHHAGFSTGGTPSFVDQATVEERDYPSKRTSSSGTCLHWQDRVIIPALSPVSWLSDASWCAMPDSERQELFQYACCGSTTQPIRPKKTPRFHPMRGTSGQTIPFGDRVVLGNGPRRVLVLVGIHGNEGCGVAAVGHILRRFRLFESRAAHVTQQDLENDTCWESKPLSIWLDQLTVEFVVGNPRAYQVSTRFLKRNLNRLLDEHLLCDDDTANREGYQYELQRARMLEESIVRADCVLDIHSCSTNVLGSFALPNSINVAEDLAKQLPVHYVVESLAHMTLEGGTTMDAALRHKTPGVCVECGQHADPDIVARAAAVISTFVRLQYFYSDDGKGCSKQETPNEYAYPSQPVVMQCVSAERVHEGFEWIQKFPEFHLVPFNTPVFRDTVRGSVRCPFSPGAHIVMPTEIPVQGEEALFWAVPAAG